MNGVERGKLMGYEHICIAENRWIDLDTKTIRCPDPRGIRMGMIVSFDVPFASPLSLIFFLLFQLREELRCGTLGGAMRDMENYTCRRERLLVAGKDRMLMGWWLDHGGVAGWDRFEVWD